MARRMGNTATDEIWIIIEVMKQSTKLRMTVRKPAALKPNEFAYRFKITTDFKAWEDRITSVDLPAIFPPIKPSVVLAGRSIGDSIEDRVTAVLSQ